MPDPVCLASPRGWDRCRGDRRCRVGDVGDRDGRYEQVGTFNGNPLAMAAVCATLSEVLTDDTYAHMEMLASRFSSCLEAAVARCGFAWHVVSVGAKGRITFGAKQVRECRDFLGIDDRLGHAHWLVRHNGGVFLPPRGKVEQWLLSVQHHELGCRPVRAQLRPTRLVGHGMTAQ